MPEWFTSQLLACQRGLRATVPKACNFSFLCVNVAINESTYHSMCQRFNLACQFFKYFSYEMRREISILLLLYKKFYILLIIAIHILCMCIVNQKCIILHFSTLCYVKEKCVEFFFFMIFFSFNLWL